jgi:hypothetical protein
MWKIQVLVAEEIAPAMLVKNGKVRMGLAMGKKLVQGCHCMKKFSKGPQN